MGSDSIRWKLVLVGDAGVGKSAFLRRHLTGDMRDEYIPTVGVDSQTLPFTTTRGVVLFDVLDIAGNGSSADTRTELLRDCNAAIIMADERATTQENIVNWHQEILSTNDSEIPIAICINKADRDQETLRIQNPIACNQGPVEYFDVSTKTTMNLEKPFLWFCRQLLRDPFLNWQVSNCSAATLPLDHEILARYRREMKDAEASPLPDEEDCDL